MVNEVRELYEFIASGGRSVLSGTSRAASTTEEPRHDVRITEIVDGLIVTRPARKYADLNYQPKQQEQTKEESEPAVVIELGGSKAGSIPKRSNVNEVKELFDFMRSNGRI
jgi:hypothetical protein